MLNQNQKRLCMKSVSFWWKCSTQTLASKRLNLQLRMPSKCDLMSACKGYDLNVLDWICFGFWRWNVDATKLHELAADSHAHIRHPPLSVFQGVEHCIGHIAYGQSSGTGLVSFFGANLVGRGTIVAGRGTHRQDGHPNASLDRRYPGTQAGHIGSSGQDRFTISTSSSATDIPAVTRNMVSVHSIMTLEYDV